MDKSNFWFIILTIIVCTSVCKDIEFNNSEGLIYAYAASLAYCPPELIMKNECKLATKKTRENGIIPLFAYSNNETLSYVIFTIMERREKHELIVSFSGTKNPIQLVLEIMQSYPASYSIHPEVKGALVFEYAYWYYLNQFRSIFHNTLMNELNKRPGYKVVFTGHSLGGSFCIHAATDAILSGWLDPSNIVIYTYGTPRVGNSEFINIVNKNVRGLFRVVHNGDPVTHIPPCIPTLTFSGCERTGYLYIYPYHNSQEIWYDDDMKNYKVCHEDEGEDPKCSNSLYDFAFMNHLSYYGFRVGRLHKDETIGDNSIDSEQINEELLKSILKTPYSPFISSNKTE